jgi:hypothetical protein
MLPVHITLAGKLIRLDVLQYKRAPLYEAACSGHLEMVNMLLAAGAEVDATDKVRLHAAQL